MSVYSDNISTAKKMIDLALEFLVKYSFQVLGGLVVLVAGFIISRIAARSISSFLRKHDVDITVVKFTAQITKLCIMIFAVLMALSNFGITITPLIAGLSVAGLGLSFAIQGPLSNYTAGATLIFTKPFKVGDIIEVRGARGEVEDMSLARTRLVTVDGTKFIVPNKQIIGEVIHNFSGFKKMDIKVGVSYKTDVKKAIEVLNQLLVDEKRIAQKPAVKAGIAEFGDSSINLYARIWCKQADYWDVLFSVNRSIYDNFAKEGVQIPFPQRDVHIYEEAASEKMEEA